MKYAFLVDIGTGDFYYKNKEDFINRPVKLLDDNKRLLKIFGEEYMNRLIPVHLGWNNRLLRCRFIDDKDKDNHNGVFFRHFKLESLSILKRVAYLL